MIRYLIKNNLKLLGRSLTNTLLLIVAPLVLIALLSAAFHDLMKTYDGADALTAGYYAESDVPAEYMEALKQIAAENGITMKEYVGSTPEEVLKRSDVAGFVVFRADSYTVYQKDDMKEAGKAIEYMVGAFYENAAAAAMGVDVSSAKLRIEQADYMTAVDSIDYYGIIEVVYFGWCAIVCGAGLFSNEKKYRIKKKYYVSNLSDTKMYLSRFVPLAVFVVASAIATAVLSIGLFGVHWGNPALSLLILTFSAMAASALGLMVYEIFDSMVVTVILVFTAVWFAGFFGGSFETYMFSSNAAILKQISPIYHINRALVELSCDGKSDYVVSALLYCTAIIAVCSAVAVFAGSIRRRGRV